MSKGPNVRHYHAQRQGWSEVLKRPTEIHLGMEQRYRDAWELVKRRDDGVSWCRVVVCIVKH